MFLQQHHFQLLGTLSSLGTTKQSLCDCFRASWQEGDVAVFRRSMLQSMIVLTRLIYQRVSLSLDQAFDVPTRHGVWPKEPTLLNGFVMCHSRDTVKIWTMLISEGSLVAWLCRSDRTSRLRTSEANNVPL